MSDFLDERRSRLNKFKQSVRRKTTKYKPIDIPSGLFVKCDKCGAAIYENSLTKSKHICPFCDYHFKIGSFKRLDYTIDHGSFQEINAHITSTNPLRMPDYEKKIIKGAELSRLNEAFLSGRAKIVGIDCAIGILDSNFMMGSMGSAVGEKVTRLVEFATNEKLPLIIFSASGGARMQEGILSLMQMAKTSAALHYFNEQRLLYISILTNPTTGGVAASFSSLGDINIAEKSSLIGFAGARVIKQTIKQDLPKGFQTDVFALEHGQVDMIVDRNDMRKTLFRLLKLHIEAKS